MGSCPSGKRCGATRRHPLQIRSYIHECNKYHYPGKVKKNIFYIEPEIEPKDLFIENDEKIKQEDHYSQNQIRSIDSLVKPIAIDGQYYCINKRGSSQYRKQDEQPPGPQQ